MIRLAKNINSTEEIDKLMANGIRIQFNRKDIDKYSTSSFTKIRIVEDLGISFEDDNIQLNGTDIDAELGGVTAEQLNLSNIKKLKILRNNSSAPIVDISGATNVDKLIIEDYNVYFELPTVSNISKFEIICKRINSAVPIATTMIIRNAKNLNLQITNHVKHLELHNCDGSVSFDNDVSLDFLQLHKCNIPITNLPVTKKLNVSYYKLSSTKLQNLADTLEELTLNDLYGIETDALSAFSKLTTINVNPCILHIGEIDKAPNLTTINVSAGCYIFSEDLTEDLKQKINGDYKILV